MLKKSKKRYSNKRTTQKKSVKKGGWKISPNRKSTKHYSISRTPNKKFHTYKN